LGHFSHDKSFVLVEIIFFRPKFGENLSVKETLEGAFPSGKFRPQLALYMDGTKPSGV
jgi:hypothetical protein